MNSKKSDLLVSEPSPWRTLSSRLVYSNEWIRLREDRVIRPDGEEGIYSVIDTRVAVGVVPVTDDGEVYLVGQYRYPLDLYSWEIPEGGTDDGEDPLVTAKRELREEAGVVAESWDLIVEEVYLSNCYTSERGVVYLARGLREVGSEPEGTEILKVVKVPFREAVSLVKDGTITDALSIIGLLTADRYL